MNPCRSFLFFHTLRAQLDCVEKSIRCKTNSCQRHCAEPVWNRDVLLWPALIGISRKKKKKIFFLFLFVYLFMHRSNYLQVSSLLMVADKIAWQTFSTPCRLFSHFNKSITWLFVFFVSDDVHICNRQWWSYFKGITFHFSLSDYFHHNIGLPNSDKAIFFFWTKYRLSTVK